MHRCGHTVVGKQEQRLDLISNRVAEKGQHPGSAGDSAGDKGGSLRRVDWSH